ncbi:MAG: hypothetical protein WD577_07025 [Bacteroidales bacterium]
MKNMITGLIIGIISGAVIALLIAFYSSPSMMLKENKSKHDFQTTMEELEKSVESHGWKIL